MKKILIFIIIVAALFGIVSSWLIFLPMESFSDKQVQFSVKKGEGSRDIALSLERNNLIRWAPMFRIYVLVRGIAGDLKAGEYLLSPSMSIPEITDKFIKGEVIKINITIPEGFTVNMIEERLGLELPGDNLEGFLFPDTYQFSFGFSGEEAVKKMQDNFEKKMTEDLREEIERQGKTIFEMVTMASLIEKEVRTLEDKKLVSGILWKRFKIGMPLQVDATIAYILELEEDKSSSSPFAAARVFDEMRREIAAGKEVDSPYNTYKYLGLPVGPICNPGLESIIAAVYPEESDYWYYLSTLEGETIFTRTLEEHNLAKAEHLK